MVINIRKIILTGLIISMFLLSSCGFFKGNDQEISRRDAGLALLSARDYAGAYRELLESLHSVYGAIGDLEFDTSYYLAYCANKMGLYEDAYDTYDSILGLRPKERLALLGRGLMSLKLSNIDSAKADFDEYLRQNKSSVSACLDIYYAFKEVGMPDEAAAYLQKAVDDNDKISDIDQGKIALYNEEYTMAQNALQKASKIDFSREVALLWGQSHTLAGDYAAATAIYEDYLDKAGDDPYILNEYGVCLIRGGSYQDALDCFISAAYSLENSSAEDVYDDSQLSSVSATSSSSSDSGAGISGVLEDIGDFMLIPDKSPDTSFARPIDSAIAFNEIVALEYLLRFDDAKEKAAEYTANFPEDFQAQREGVFLQSR